MDSGQEHPKYEQLTCSIKSDKIKSSVFSLDKPRLTKQRVHLSSIGLTYNGTMQLDILSSVDQIAFMICSCGTMLFSEEKQTPSMKNANCSR